MKKILLLCTVLVLSACAVFQAETTQQKWFGVKQDYLKVVTAAAGYKQDCDQKPVVDKCHKIVKEVQSKDKIVFALVQTGDALATKGGSEQSILTYIADIQAGVLEIETLIKE